MKIDIYKMKKTQKVTINLQVKCESYKITIISEDTGDPLNKILGQVMTTESRIGQLASTNQEVVIEAKALFIYVLHVSVLFHVFNLTYS